VTEGHGERPEGGPGLDTTQEDPEKRLVLQAEIAYRRFISDWQAMGRKKVGAGVTPERASPRP
jgi:hypothetical protein